MDTSIVKALCNTLIYSLWQGLVLAALAALIVVFTRKATSATRYNLLVASLCLFTASVAYTFVGQLRIAHNDPVKAFAYNLTTAQIHAIDVTTPAVKHDVNFTDNMLGYLNSHANIIVLIWSLVVCARSVQMLTGFNSIYHLRRKHLFDIGEQWQNKIFQLSAGLGITSLVRVAGSGMAKVPMVVGHLKPIILIPVGLITALTAEEVEAILVHELAHIRRRDYLVNLMQSFMEIIFFFNPAVLWISGLIRTERENCCDDIALAQTSNKASYIRALVSCQEYQFYVPDHAMAFGGQKDHLLGRVKRMVSNNDRSLNIVERSLLAVCLLAATLLTTAFSNAGKINELVTATTKAVEHVSDAVKNELTPDPPAEAAMPKQIAALEPSVCEIKPEFLPVDTARMARSASTADRLAMEQDVRWAFENEKLTHAQLQLEANMQKLKAINTDQSKLAALKDSLATAMNIHPTVAGVHLPPKAAGDHDTRSYKDALADSLRNSIIYDMVNDGIIGRDHASLSFKLSTKEFIVNGRKQSDDVYNKYRAKYIKVTGHNNWTWYYNYDTDTKTRTETNIISSSTSSSKKE